MRIEPVRKTLVAALVSLVSIGIGVLPVGAAPLPVSAAHPTTGTGLTLMSRTSTRGIAKAQTTPSEAPEFVAPIEVPLGLGHRSVGGFSQVVGLAAGHFTASGHEDLALTAYDNTGGTYVAEVMPGNGDGTFGAPLMLPVPNSADTLGGIIPAALGGTGTDLVVTDESAKTLDVFTPSGATWQMTPVALPAAPTEVQAADLGNGHVDLVAMIPSSSEVVPVVNNGTTFTAGTPLKVTGTPTDLALAPLTTGGEPDIVVAVNDSSATNGIQYFTNAGNATFGASPTALADGIRDTKALYVGAFAGSTADILAAGSSCALGPDFYCQVLVTGNGAGSFASPTAANASGLGVEPTRGPSANGTPPSFDGSGHLDAVWAQDGIISGGERTMFSVALGDGTGNFSIRQQIATDETIDAADVVVAAQITSAGEPWLVFAGSNDYSANGGLWLVPPSTSTPGTFESGSIYPAIPAANQATYGLAGTGMVSGRFDKSDPGPDLVTLGSSGALNSNQAIDVLHGAGGGRFGPETATVNVNLFHPTGGLATGDFNGDGNADIAWLANGGDGIGYALGNGDGTFQTPVYVADASVSALGNADMHFVDLSSTGTPALAVDGESNGQQFLEIYPWDQARGTFDAPQDTTIGAPSSSEGPTEVAFGSFAGTGSGDTDAAIASGNNIEVLPGNGTGGFGTPVTVGSFSGTGGAIAAGDLTGNGLDDLVWEAGGDVFVAFNNGDGTFSGATSYPEVPDLNIEHTSATHLELADISGRGPLDILSLGGGQEYGLVVLPDNGDGTFGSAEQYALGNDLDGEGSSMVVTSLTGGTAEDVAVEQAQDINHPANLITVLQSTAGNTGLTASGVSAPTSTVLPGQAISSSWTVTDDGTEPVDGPWTDSLFVGTSPVFNAGDQLVGTVTHNGALDPGASYSASLNAPLPGVPAGSRYLIVVPDSGGRFSWSDAGAAASGAFAVGAIPSLTIGGPASTGTIKAGQIDYFSVAPAVGRDLIVSGSFGGAAGAVTLADRLGEFPDPASGAVDQTAAAGTTEILRIDHPDSANYYVMIEGNAGAGSGVSFSVLATQPAVSVTGFSPSGFGLGLPIGCEVVAICQQVTIEGSGFTPATTLSFLSVTPRVPDTDPSSVTFVDSNTLVASFTGGHFLSSGFGGASYRVKATTGASSATSSVLFTVDPTIPISCPAPGAARRPASPTIPGDGIQVCGASVPVIDVGVEAPAVYRSPAPGTVTVSWHNNTPVDQPAPVIMLDGTDAVFNDPTTGLPTGQSDIQLLGVGAGATPGTLGPAESGSITLTFTEPTVATSTFTAYVVDPNFKPDWSQMESGSQPPGESTAAWSKTFANFELDAGSTFGSYQTLLDDAANYLAQTGSPPNGDAEQELALELASAGDFGEVQSVEGTGSMGAGALDAMDGALAVVDAAGDVQINRGANPPLLFLARPDGSYISPLADPEVLSKQANGDWELALPGGGEVLWSPTGALLTRTDANGNTLTYNENGGGEVSGTSYGLGGFNTTASYDSAGHLSGETTARGQNVHFSYTGTTGSSTLTGVTTATESTGIAYGTLPDGTGKAPASITLAGGVVERFTYNARDQVTSEAVGNQKIMYDYGPFGEVTTTNATGAATTIWLDASGHVVRMADSQGEVTSYSYNAANDLTSETLPSGATTSWNYNRSGEVTSEVDASGAVTSYSYNSAGRVAILTDPDGNTTSYAYDTHDNLTKITYPDGTADAFTYQPNGLMSGEITQAGQRVTYAYATNDLLTSVTVNGTKEIGYSYNGNNLVSSATDAAGATVTVGYDADGKLTSLAEPGGSNLSIAYDTSGRVTSESDQSGYELERHYNNEGLLSSLSDGSGNTLETLGYDAEGRLLSRTFANGTSAAYTYNGDGLVASLVNKSASGAVTSSYATTYNGDGLPVSVTGPGGVSSYAYDADGRLTSAALPGGHSESFTYDAAGNRLSATVDGTTTDYTVNDMNEYTKVGGQTFTYDPNGDLVGENGPAGHSSFTYSPTDQITSMTTPAGTASFGYDALGYRTSVTRGATTTGYLPDPRAASGNFDTLDNTGSVTGHLIDDGTALLGSTGTGGSPTETWLSADPSGNIVGATDGSGAAIGSATYAPFGAVLSSSLPSGVNGFGGSSGLTTEPSGLAFVGVRGYDPSTGSFVSPDWSSPALGRYAFADNSPLAFTDPTGYVPVIETGSPSGESTSPSEVAGQGASAAETAGIVVETTAGSWEGTSETATELANHLGSNTPAGGQAANAAADFEQGASGLSVVGTGLSMTSGALEVGEAGANIGSPGETTMGAVSDATTIIITVPAIPLALVPPAWPYVAGVAAANQAGKATAATTQTWFEVMDTDYAPWGPTAFHKLHPGWRPVGTTSSKNGFNLDPNNIFGPAGVGSHHWLADGGVLPYTVTFSNDAKATLPVQVAKVSEKLDKSVDLATFRFGTVGFATTTYVPPAGVTSWSTTLADTPSVSVRVDGVLNLSTRVVTWTFTSVDPATGVQLSDPTAGFLPPDTSPPAGEGYVTYSVAPEPRLTTGTAIHAQATVFFDQNKPLSTPTLSNLIDSTIPGAKVSTIPAVTPAGPLRLSWIGLDANGPGVMEYDVYESIDHGSLKSILVTKASGVVVTTKAGHRYGFSVIPTDDAGNGGGIPLTPILETSAVVGRFARFVTPPTTIVTVGGPVAVTIRATGEPVPSISETGKLPAGLTFHAGTAGVATLTGIARTVGRYAFDFTAANGAGPVAIQHFVLVIVPPQGYYLAGRDGTVLAAGKVPSLAGFPAAATDPVVGITTTPDGKGWFAVTADGTVHVAGDAVFRGDLLRPRAGQKTVHATDLVAIVATGDGAGYWLLGADGEVYPYGDASFHGDLLHLPGGKSIHVSNIVGMVASPSGGGYLLIGTDGGVFAFGAVRFFGSLPGHGVKAANIRGILPAPGDTGYVLVGTDGGAFVFGSGAPFKGSLPGEHIKVNDIVGLALSPDGQGYWMAGSDGNVYRFGDALHFPANPGLARALPIAAIGGT